MTEHAAGRSECEACAGYPVGHTATYINETITSWMSSALDRLQRISFLAPALRYADTGSIFFEASVIRALFGIGSVSSQPGAGCLPRAQVIWHEAQARGITMQQLVLFGYTSDLFRAKLGGTWIYFRSLPIPPQLRTREVVWADDKYLFKDFLLTHNVPTARAAFVTGRAGARDAFKKLHAPLVAKPRIGSNSRHTTTFIQTPDELEAAFDSARQLCRYVLIEEHIAGNLCRATVVDGKLLGFLESQPPRIVGNGTSTIRELVAKKNAERDERVGAVEFTSANVSHLARQGYSPESVPKKDEAVSLSRLSGVQAGGQAREMLERAHPHLRQCVERTARLMGTPVVGFDLIIKDPEADPDTQLWGILEANTNPFIELHHHPYEGTPSNVAAAVWDLWPLARRESASEIVDK